MDVDYVFDVHSHLVETKITTLSLCRNELLDLFSNKDAKPFNNIKKRYDRVLKISQILQSKLFLNKVIDKEVNMIFQDVDPEEMFEEQMLLRMKRDLFEKFWIQRGS